MTDLGALLVLVQMDKVWRLKWGGLRKKEF